MVPRTLPHGVVVVIATVDHRTHIARPETAARFGAYPLTAASRSPGADSGKSASVP
jgi:hypothetical protein